jgi:hypothetical protein
MSQELTPEAQAVVEKAAKLLAVAARTSSAEEAASFSAKAMELLATYNLDVATVERHGSDAQSGRRKQDEVRGGMYSYQQELWRALADLNFCVHRRIAHYVERRIPRRLSDGTLTHRMIEGREHRHTLIGRVVNVVMTRNIGTYLESQIESLVRQRFPLNSQRFKREAVAFREGIADELVDRLREKRRERVAADQARARAAANGAVGEQALTLADIASREEDANYDFIHGEGASARRRQRQAEWSKRIAEERARQAEADRIAEEAYTAWAEAKPEEAAREARKERDATRRRDARASRRGWSYRGRAPTAAELRAESPYFRQGRTAAASIGLDIQAESRSSKSAGALTHG